MIKEVQLTANEAWILFYGDYRVTPNEDYIYTLDVDKAIKAEAQAYKDLTFNQNLLSECEYRERRLDVDSHVSLRNKLL